MSKGNASCAYIRKAAQTFVMPVSKKVVRTSVIPNEHKGNTECRKCDVGEWRHQRKSHTLVVCSLVRFQTPSVSEKVSSLFVGEVPDAIGE